MVDDLAMPGSKAFVFVLAPLNTSITNLTMTSFMVNITSYTGNPQVESLEVTLKGGCEHRVCNLTRPSGNLTCPMPDLLPATKYVVKSVACFAGDLGCSSPFVLKTWTIPSRECWV